MSYVLNSRFTPICLFVIWTLASATLLFGWIGIAAIPAFVVWCVLWGFVSGALVTAPIAAISPPILSPSPGELGTRMGMSWFAAAAAAGELIGASNAGALAIVHARRMMRMIKLPRGMGCGVHHHMVVIVPCWQHEDL